MDGAAVLLDKLLAEHQSKPRPLFVIGAVGRMREVGLEKVVHHFGRHAHPVIGNLDKHVGALAVSRQGYHAVAGRKLDGVIKQVADHQLEGINIGTHRQGLVQFRVDPDRLQAGRGGIEFHDFMDDLGQVEIRGLDLDRV